ncbi:MAG TPA: extracellular solute-binding protein [Eubacteriales bacterium]|jgi:ABC-type glycerol-3-phosphate transport system substrate-binding protein|nr:extracellular solute-binding protein [Eubacteriales bacterium]HRU84744.1 extracellular solute-binding protein [Eubacteriales bacterium]
MKKKPILVLLTLLFMLIALSFFGCKKGGGNIKVSIGMWPDSSLAQDVAMFTKWKEAFEKDYPQYEIVADSYTYSPDTFVAKAVSGTLPTVFQTYFTEPQKLIDNGFIKDITDKLNMLGWADKMDADMKAAVSRSGRIYGVPRDGYGLGLFLNLDMLYSVGVIDKDDDGSYVLHDEFGEPLYPTTFEDIYNVSRLITENYVDTYGIVILSADKNGGWQFSNMAWNFGATALQVKNSDNSWSANLNDAGAVAALEWIQRMKQDELITPDTSLSYAQWYNKIGSRQVAMAFAGSDVIALPVTNFNFDKDNIAFVPMPTGDGVHRYSLYGGTPFVFSAKASDEQVEGALRFLKYMGRSPETDEISVSAMRTGHTVAQAKGMPILPTIKPWINSDYLNIARALEEEFVNVNLYYFQDFFNSIDEMKKPEEPYFAQDMYALLDNAIQAVLANPYTAVPANLLTTADNQFQINFMSKVK